jgi:endonuclease-3 related protein
VGFLIERYRGSLARMGKEDTGSLREKLLGVKGVGPETADSILLYALEKPVFVIDAYTKRVLSRHGIMDHGEPYEKFQKYFHARLANPELKVDAVRFFNEYHALFVMAGKTYCRPRNPLCDICPLNGVGVQGSL